MASNNERLLPDLSDSIVNLDEDRLRRSVETVINSKMSAYDALMNGMAKGMNAIGRMYENGECFLPELLAAGDLMKTGLQMLQPHLKAEKAQMSGRVIIGTVQGDLHDLGKNIVIAILRSAGFEVYDLGIDVASNRFVEKVREGGDILAMSSLLTTTSPYMREVIAALTRTGLRKTTKVIVGGLPVTEEYAREIEADAYGKDAFDGLAKIKALVKDKTDWDPS
jgi:methanogenic corrinoid protein MtbC1